jgi:hypothetical protein
MNDVERLRLLEMPIRAIAYYCNNTKCSDCDIKKYISCTQEGQCVNDRGVKYRHIGTKKHYTMIYTNNK